MENVRPFLEKMYRVRRSILRRNIGRLDRKMHGYMYRLEIELSRQNTNLVAWAKRNKVMIYEIIPGQHHPHHKKWMDEFNDILRTS